MSKTYLTDERALAAYLSGVHMTLLRLGVSRYPEAILVDVQAAVFRAGPSQLRNAALPELEGKLVLVVNVGRHVLEAIDRLEPPEPGRGYR